MEGSIFLFARAIQRRAKRGAIVKIKPAFKDWNIEAGTSQPRITLSTPLSVSIFSEDPACSKRAQKINENNINIPTTIKRSLSSGSHLNKAYINQAPINMNPNPPRSCPTSCEF